MVNFLKEFLKPNWWKLGIVIIMILLYFTLEIGMKDVVVGKDPEVIIGGEVVTYLPVTERYFNPIIWPFANTLRNSVNKQPIVGNLYFIIVFIYWYLLACLTYFLFTKIKKRFTLKKTNIIWLQWRLDEYVRKYATSLHEPWIL